ncbi:nucleotide exchange factor GrpE [Thermogemmatispora sp.]|uniref:nucleotide exchange factor GrpE n=1 Tax=Thermogemmatispora sp. TaxID=1968838 RepID=UPI001D3BE1A9|nr:nucleotide exchange factor GrpE [Thermogemmatispora sp.]MBX5450443.1 nucleotide exchange factor GrpE [Thermogemmatispora sp.]
MTDEPRETTERPQTEPRPQSPEPVAETPQPQTEQPEASAVPAQAEAVEPSVAAAAEEQPAPTLEERVAQLEAQLADLTAQLAQARQEARENWDKFVRERADLENFRKRRERDIADRVLQQKKALLNKLLEVMDNLDRALAYQDSLDRQGLQQTLRLVAWQMNELIRSEGLTPVPTVGEQFNPYIHEAVEAVEDSEKPEGIVVEEVRKGYKLSDETLRPARVKVTVAASNKEREQQGEGEA